MAVKQKTGLVVALFAHVRQVLSSYLGLGTAFLSEVFLSFSPLLRTFQDDASVRSCSVYSKAVQSSRLCRRVSVQNVSTTLHYKPQTPQPPEYGAGELITEPRRFAVFF
jgi:hypothetical protein